MARNFYIYMDTGVALGPYNAYYNSVSPSNILSLYYGGGGATGLTYSQVTTFPGVGAVVPDDASSVIMVNTSNSNQQVIMLATQTPTQTPTYTPTPSITASQTQTPTNTSTQTPTNTSTQTPTNTSTQTQTPTNTATQTMTPTTTSLSIQYTISQNFYGDNTDACRDTGTDSVVFLAPSYIISPEVGAIIYTDSTLTTKFSGSTGYYKMYRDGVSWSIYTETDVVGPTQAQIQSVVNCTTIPSQTPTQTPTYTQTPTPSITASQTQTPTNTQTLTPTRTQTPTPSITASQTQTPTRTQTATPSNTATQTSTQTPTKTQTPTQTQTPSPTPFAKFTASLSPTSQNEVCYQTGAIPVDIFTIINSRSVGSTFCTDNIQIRSAWLDANGASYTFVWLKEQGTETVRQFQILLNGGGGFFYAIPYTSCSTCPTQTATPSQTPTQTPTQTSTPASTPASTPTPTSTSTPASTPTPTSTLVPATFTITWSNNFITTGTNNLKIYKNSNLIVDQYGQGNSSFTVISSDVITYELISTTPDFTEVQIIDSDHGTISNCGFNSSSVAETTGVSYTSNATIDGVTTNYIDGCP
jgi:hypothetical protein